MPDRGSTYNHFPLPVTSGGLTLLFSFQRRRDASAAETRAVNEVVPPSFTLQSYEIEDPIYSEFDMLQREK